MPSLAFCTSVQGFRPLRQLAGIVVLSAYRTPTCPPLVGQPGGEPGRGPGRARQAAGQRTSGMSHVVQHGSCYPTVPRACQNPAFLMGGVSYGGVWLASNPGRHLPRGAGRPPRHRGRDRRGALRRGPSGQPLRMPALLRATSSSDQPGCRCRLDTQRHKDTKNTQIHKYTNTKTQRHTYTMTQTHTHKHTQTHTDTQTHTHAHTYTQTHRHTDTQTHRHTDTPQHASVRASACQPCAEGGLADSASGGHGQSL